MGAETWLVPETEQLFDISGYNSFYCSRSTRGGGVPIYVRNFLNKVAKINDIIWVCESIECNFLKIENNVFIVGCIYRPPNSNADVFRIKLSNILNYVDNNFPQYSDY